MSNIKKGWTRVTHVRQIKVGWNQMDAQDVVEEFLANCRVQGLSEDSIRSHGYALRHFFDDFEVNFKDTGGMRKAIGQMLQGKNDAYYNKQLNGLRRFFDYCIQEGLIETNPAKHFKYRRPTVQVVDHSEESIKALLKVIDKNTFAGLRDYAFVILMLDTGIRPSEALQLKVEDIYFDTRQVRVRREYAKTRRERYLPVSAQVLHTFRKLIAVRPEDWKNDVPILCTYDGHKMLPRGIQDRLRDYSKMIKANITPYHLRHVFGLWFIRNGGDVFALQNILGHAKMDMTRVYVNLANEDIRMSHEKASPLVNMVSGKRVKKI